MNDKALIIQTEQQVLLQPSARNCGKEHVFDAVRVAVAKAFADLNYKKITTEERDYLLNELTKSIMERYPSIRISEIPDAIARGIRGHYGEYFGLSVITFEKFIAAHLASEQRLMALQSLPPPPELPRPAPTADEQFNTMLQNTLMAQQRKAAGKDYESMAPIVYDFLTRLKLLHYTNAEKYDMMADATRLIVDEIKIKLLMAAGYARYTLKKDIATYRDAINGGALSDEQYARVVRKTKKLGLDAFFNGVVMGEEDLEKMILGAGG